MDELERGMDNDRELEKGEPGYMLDETQVKMDAELHQNEV